MVKTCLNGWWDFYPVYDYNKNEEIPTQGWLPKSYLVPSLWRKPLDCVKTKKEEYFRASIAEDLKDIESLEFLYDDFNYPNIWTTTKKAWARTKFFIESIDTNTQYLLLLEAVMPYSKVYVNNILASVFSHPTLPNEIDISQLVTQGTNELCVLMFDYDKDKHNRYMTPTGTMMIADNAGIWQDVYFCQQNRIHVADCFIKTYYLNRSIEVAVDIENLNTCNANLETYVYIADKTGKERKFLLGHKEFSLEAMGTNNITFEEVFKQAILWEPNNPHLYTIVIELYSNKRLLDVHTERFGFRQVWIEGKNVMLNGSPIHLFSDWGHKVTTYQFTKEWINNWFSMIKDGNMNHTRLHTCPHPKLILDMADERGILVTGETGLHGSGGYQASNSDMYWENAKEHVKRFVKRDKNHPCLIMWSVENEMRWNQQDDEQLYPEKILKNLPLLKQLFNELDPTRPAYHEGDSSLWDEASQDIISRHYGKDGVGADWWDEKKPLHFGEMALYHYEGPNTAINIIGDKAYTSHKHVDVASATDAKMIIEYGRAKGISCFGPWNQSCLKLIRNSKKDIVLKYKDFSTPGIKPLFVKAHTSEFNFWQKKNTYKCQESFNIQKEAFRAFAIVDYSQNTTYSYNDEIMRIVNLINDTTDDVFGTFSVYLNDSKIYEKDIKIGKGFVETINVHFTANMTSNEYISNHSLKYQFISDGILLDNQYKDIFIYNESSMYFKNLIKRIGKNKITTYDCAELEIYFQKSGISFVSINSLEDIRKCNTDILIIGKNAVSKKNDIHKQMSRIVDQKINILLMEQEISPFKDIKISVKPVLTAFKTNNIKQLRFIKNDYLKYWGTDPYTKVNSDAFVATSMYQKECVEDDVKYLLESGEGSFGRGDLTYSPLLLISYENAAIMANQMSISNKLLTTPQAQHLLLCLIDELFKYKPKNKNAYVLQASEYNRFKDIKSDILCGSNLMIYGITMENVKEWKKLLDIKFEIVLKDDIYQGEIKSNDKIMESISNEDLNGINTFSYSNKKSTNHIICFNPIEKNKQMKTIVQTCENSMMKELFVHEGHTELRRAYTISKYAHATKKRKEYAIVASFRYGQGTIYINQLHSNNPTAKFNRLMQRLRQNIILDLPKKLFDFDYIQYDKSSEGFPEKLHVSKAIVNERSWQEYMATSKNNNERMPHKKTISIGDWTIQDSATTSAESFDLSKDQDILITYNIFSSEPRKNLTTNLSIPNPEALTFLHLKGDGIVRLAVNGQDLGQKNLKSNCIYSDIALEKGINYIILSWRPRDRKSNLKMQWKNINLRSEIGFEFFL